jgi:D-alanyl-D-alanine carboxypeptidase
MPNTQPAPATRRRARSTLLAVLFLVVALTGGCRSPATQSSGAPPSDADPAAHRPHARLGGHVPDAPGLLQAGRHHVLGVVDGEVPDGVTLFDDDYPAVANLDPALLDALRRAAAEAESDGIEFYVNSGWRSRAYQERLLADAIAKYGSRAEAARWVATPSTSPHVSGDAVDLGKSVATEWLSEHGAQYGLCQIYRNEPWHYEFRADAISSGCPTTYADPTQDPRMQP